MPEVVSLSDRRGYLRITASPKYSSALLNIDYNRDVICLVFELLRGICHDHTRLFGRNPEIDRVSHPAPDSIEAHAHAGIIDPAAHNSTVPVDPRHLIVARLNVLVFLSKRVFLRLEVNCDLYEPVLEAIYKVIRLTLWSHNRSVRCASLRCLRYYIRSAQDIQRLLRLRLDLLLARCLDLSYFSDESCNRRSVNFPAPRFDTRRPAGLRPTRFHGGRSASGESPTSSSVVPESTQASRLMNSSFARNAIRIHPRMRTSRPSQLAFDTRLSDVIDNIVTTTPNSPPGRLSSSNLVSDVGERQLFLRLTYHLVRIAPHLFPRSLIQAVAAPCLRAGRFQSTGGFDPIPHPREAPPRSPMRFVVRPTQGPAAGIAPRNAVTACDQIRASSEDEANPITTDVALRTCLLILAELVIVAPEHVTDLEQISITRSDLNRTYTSDSLHFNDFPSDSTQAQEVHIPSESHRPNDSIIVQALMSAFASCATLNTIHPARIQEAVLFALLNLLNQVDTARLVPVNRIAKLFVPFSSTFSSHLRPRTMFDCYPSYMSCAKTCLTMMFRSWSGLYYFLHDGFSCLRTLMHSLAVGGSEIRDQILDLLFGLFPALPKPHPSTRDIDPAILGLLEALASGAPSTLPVLQLNAHQSADEHSISTGSPSEIGAAINLGPSVLPRRRAPPSAWDIQGGFVAYEGLRVFPRPACGAPGLDLMDSYSALLLATLIQAGLYEALIRAVSDSQQAISVRAGILLGLLAYRACRLLPADHPAARRLHQCGLLRSSTGGTQPAVLWLERVHRVMHAHDLRRTCPAKLVLVPIHSPFLECLARQSRSTSTQTNILADVLPSADGSSHSEIWIDQIINQSGVIPSSTSKSSSLSVRSSHAVSSNEELKPPDQWDWETLASLGRFLCESRSMISWEPKHRLRFLQRLMDFFTPTSTVDSTSANRASRVSDRSSSITTSILATKSHLPFSSSDSGGVNKTSIPSAASLTQFRPKDNAGNLIHGPRSLTSLSAAFGASDSLTARALGNPSMPVSCTGLASLPFTWPHAPAAGILIAGLIPHLAIYPLNSEPGQLLTRFLSATRDALERSLPPATIATTESDHYSSSDTDQAVLFSATQLADTCSGLIILAVGRLTGSEVGESRLEASKLCGTFHRLLLPTGLSIRAGRKISLTESKQETLISLAKVLLSSLDFTRPGRLGHQLLTAAVNGAIKPVRLYAVQLIRLLFRLQLPFLSSWCVDLVVKLCLDSSRRVTSHALQLLEEICWDSVNIHALTRSLLPELDQSVTHSNHTTPVTPLLLRLLDPRSGPIGHRIFALVLSQSEPFKKLTDAPTDPHSATTDALERSTSPNPSVVATCPDPVTSPVHWFLEVTKIYFNIAYACEMDSRLWSLFTSRTTITIQSILDQWSRANLSAVNPPSTSPMFSRFKDHISSYGPNEVESDSSTGPNHGGRESSVFRCAQREIFHFDETDSTCVTNTPGLRIPPALMADSNCAWFGEALSNCWSCPLPRHPYGCLAEHPAGMELLLERGDLDTLVHTLQSAQSCWITNCSIPESMTAKSESNRSSDTTRSVSVMETKGALWALAHVGSAACGQAWMAKNPGLIQLYMQFATEGQSMGLRAVAWLCLNLLVSKSGGGLLVSQAAVNSCTDRFSVPVAPSAGSANGVVAMNWLVTDPCQGSTTSPETTESDIRILSESNEQPQNDPLAANAQYVKRTPTAFSVHAVPLSDEKPDGTVLFADFKNSPSEVPMQANNVNGQSRTVVQKGPSSRKSFGRSTFSSLSSRTRRLLPRRRWSPRRHKHGSSSLATVTSTDRAQNYEQTHDDGKSCGRMYIRHSSMDSASHLRNSIAGYHHAEQSNPAFSSAHVESAIVARSCATWNHRDQWIYRDTLLASCDTKNTTFPVDPTEFGASHGPDSAVRVTSSYQPICLPADVRILGQLQHRTASLGGQVDEPSVTVERSSNCGPNPIFAIAHQLSFIRIAADAQLVLDKYDVTEAQSLPESALISSDPDGTECQEQLDLTRLKNHAPFSSKLLDGHLPINGVTPERHLPDGFRSKPQVDEIQQNQCCLRIRSHRTVLKNEAVSSRSPLALGFGCLSPTCQRHSLLKQSGSGSLRSDRTRWLSRLLDVITGLLANVFSSSHELALKQLIQAACAAQDCETSTSAELTDGERLFDSCAYTEVAILLQDYTFPLEARTKIQSAFLGLELYDLFVDAKRAVTTLEQHITKLSPVSASS